jgi:hypothetical protein
VLFDDVFLAGFECSCHRLADGRRLDLLASTRHRELADADYRRVRAVGMTACRDGVSWLNATRPRGEYDFATVKPMLDSARRHGLQVIWDLMHFGWPDDVDVFAPSFAGRFAHYASAFARWLASETDAPPFLTLINEMSYLSWAGGDARYMNPFEAARGVELKVQLVRATIEAIDRIRASVPRSRFLQPEPIIHVVPERQDSASWNRAESDDLGQYQAWDMLTGAVWPSLGGHPRYLDVVGVNFYPQNQFTLDRKTVARGDPRYKPLSRMLVDVWRRYARPMIVSETGAEGDERADWLRYVSSECVRALDRGCDLHGVTLYPVLSHPGWLDDRRCEVGLWGYANDAGERELHEPLLREIERQRGPLIAARRAMWRPHGEAAPCSSDVRG